MRGAVVMAALVGSTGCGLLRSSAELPAGTLGEQVVRTAPSGLRIVTQSARAAPVVALELSIAAGSADDPPDASGAALVLDHLAVAGSGLESFARSQGGALETWITRDETRVSMLLPARALVPALRRLARATLAPRLDGRSLDRHLGTVVAGFRRARADSSRLAIERAVAVAFPDRSYGRSPWASPDALARLGSRPLRRMHHALWHPTNMTLAIVGDLDSEQAVRAAISAFGSDRRPARRRAPTAPAAHSRQGLRFEIVGDREDGSAAVLAFHLPELAVGELAVLELAAALLEGGRLADVLRRAGVEIAGPPSATVQTTQAGTLFFVTSSVGARDAGRALEEILLEVARLGRLGPTGTEMDRARAALAAADADARDGAQGLARVLLESTTHPRAAAARVAARRRATPSGFGASFGSLIVPDRAIAVALVPEDEVATTRRSLETLSGRVPIRAERELAPGTRRTSGGAIHESLGSGLRLVTALDRRSPVAVLRLTLVGGNRIENDARRGASALVARAMARTARESGPPLEIVPFAGRDTYGMESRFAAARLDEAITRMARGLVRPSLDAASLEPERRAALAAVRDSERSPRAGLAAALAALVFGRHATGLQAGGSLATLPGLDGEVLAALHRETLVADRLVIVAVGDVDAEGLSRRVRGLLGSLARGAPLPGLAPIPAQPRREHRVAPGPAAEIGLAMVGASWADPDRAAFDVMAAVLDGPDGRIARALEARGLGTSPWARHVPGLSSGSFEAGATVPASNVEASIAVVRAAIGRLSSEALAPADLVRAREIALGRWETSLDGLGTRAAALSMAELAGVELRDHSAHLARVDAARLRATAGRRLRADRAHVVVIGPEPAP